MQRWLNRPAIAALLIPLLVTGCGVTAPARELATGDRASTDGSAVAAAPSGDGLVLAAVGDVMIGRNVALGEPSGPLPVLDARLQAALRSARARGAGPSRRRGTGSP